MLSTWSFVRSGTALPALFLLMALLSTPLVDAQNGGCGKGLAGVDGVPELDFEGNLFMPGETITVTLRNAEILSPATLFIGGSREDFPILGGTLVPSPDLVINTTTNAAGEASVTFVWPEFLNDRHYYQWVVADPAAVQGVAFSNAMWASGGDGNYCLNGQHAFTAVFGPGVAFLQWADGSIQTWNYTGWVDTGFFGCLSVYQIGPSSPGTTLTIYPDGDIRMNINFVGPTVYEKNWGPAPPGP